jgi:CRP/FNR family transcriptional regulator, cyclic AMP receptor protein
MPLIPDVVALQEDFAALPIASYHPGEIVVSAGSKTGRLMILRKGTVTIAKNGIEIARVSDPGAVFGELSFLLDQPLAADIFALEHSEFHVADAAAFLAQHSLALNDIAEILARRIDFASEILIDLKSQLNADRLEINWADHHEELPDATGASLVYAGYPFDPYALRCFVVHQINAVCLLLSAR